jgi:hypothetical protein
MAPQRAHCDPVHPDAVLLEKPISEPGESIVLVRVKQGVEPAKVTMQVSLVDDTQKKDA